MVYDAADGYTLLFGGCPYWGGLYWSHACTALGDTWTLSGGVWTNITASLAVAPPARADAGIAYDSADHCVVLFGGFDGLTLYNDTWTFSGGAWTPMHPTASPPARFSPGMVGDGTDHEVVLFGGSTNGNSPLGNWTSFNDTWTYHAGAWTQVVTSIAPTPRFSMTMSYDPVDGYVLLFSGWSPSMPLSFGDTWTFANGTWTDITVSGGPIPRNYAAMAFDPALNASIMTGGHVEATAYSDTWAQNGTSGWQSIPTATTPPPRWGLELSYDVTSQALYLFGGVDATSTFYNDTWELDPFVSNGTSTNSSGHSLIVYPLLAAATPRSATGVAPFAVNFTASQAGGSGPYSYLWTIGAGLGSSSLQDPTFVFTTAGNFSVQLNVSDAAAHTAANRLVVEVVNALALHLGVNAGSGVAPLSLVLTAGVTGGLAPYSFDWGGLPTGCTAVNQAVLHCNATAAGNFTPTVTVTDRLGERAQASTTVAVTSPPATMPPSGGGQSMTYFEVGVIAAAVVVVLALVAVLYLRSARKPPAGGPPN